MNVHHLGKVQIKLTIEIELLGLQKNFNSSHIILRPLGLFKKKMQASLD